MTTKREEFGVEETDRYLAFFFDAKGELCDKKDAVLAKVFAPDGTHHWEAKEPEKEGALH
jgi:hypothetical protein